MNYDCMNFKGWTIGLYVFEVQLYLFDLGWQKNKNRCTNRYDNIWLSIFTWIIPGYSLVEADEELSGSVALCIFQYIHI